MGGETGRGVTDEGQASLKPRSMMLRRCEARIGGGVAPPIQSGWRGVEKEVSRKDGRGGWGVRGGEGNGWMGGEGDACCC